MLISMILLLNHGVLDFVHVVIHTSKIYLKKRFFYILFFKIVVYYIKKKLLIFHYLNKFVYLMIINHYHVVQHVINMNVNIKNVLYHHHILLINRIIFQQHLNRMKMLKNVNVDQLQMKIIY